MKLIPFALAALVCGSAMAQAPNAADRAENRATVGQAADKLTPGPAERARNRAKAADLADKATPDARERAQNRAKAAQLGDKLTPGPAERARNRAKAAELANRVTGRDEGGTTMGAGSGVNSTAGDRGDRDRSQRMDEAYGNWQRQQGSR